MRPNRSFEASCLWPCLGGQMICTFGCIVRDTGKGWQAMKDQFTAVVKKDGDWWIGWIEEVPGVNCQERSREELLESLRITLGEALEMNRADAKEAAGKDYE